MYPGRRATLGLFATAALAAPAVAAPALDRTARILVGLPAGTGPDAVSRLLAEALRDRYAPQVVVENRPGASTRLAVEAVKAAAPDGATILQTPMPVLTLMPHVFPRTTRYDALADFAPVVTEGVVPYGWVVKADHPAQNLAEFLAWARAKGGGTFAPPVLGSAPHMIGLEVGRRAGVAMTAVSYRGDAPAQSDVLAGALDSVISTMAGLVGLLEAGRTRLLAVSSAARLPAWPAAPTLAEQGYGGLPVDEAFCLMLPARTPDALVAALHAAVAEAVATPAVAQGFARLALTPLVLGPAETAARIRAERETWGPVVQSVGFNADD
jgi:tripartite-type tricarboxylate transporter receptor subunit TctC